MISHSETRLHELYLKSASGDKEAYREFLQICSEISERLLSFISRNEKLSSQLDDIKEEVLVKIHTKKHTYRPESAILPWIHAIVRYTYIDYCRKMKEDVLVEEFPEISDVE